jgi:hypothetical protein
LPDPAEAISAASSTIQRDVSLYGSAVWCEDSIVTGKYARGKRAVAQAIYRRLITPRGMLFGGKDEQDFGLDVIGLIGSSVSPAEKAAIPSRIKAEILKDERVITAEVDMSTDDQIVISAYTDTGPFDLVLSSSAVGLEQIGFAS